MREPQDDVDAGAAVRGLVENWAKAVRDRDIDAILAHHSSGMVMYDVTPPFQVVGLDAYSKTWSPFFENTKEGVFDIQSIQMAVGDNVAFCFAAMKCEDKDTNGDYVPLDFRLTVGLEKVDDRWTIVHEHHSVPSEE